MGTSASSLSPRAATGRPALVWADLGARLLRRTLDVNKEALLVFSLILMAGLLNFVVASNRMVLGFYTLPTLASAYLYGRRHATLTALASILLVVLVVYFNPAFGASTESFATSFQRWLEIAAWGGILLLTGYAMGTLYEHSKAQLRELRETYNGILVILQQFISKDKYTQNHSCRVSVYAPRIGAQMGLSEDRLEDIRAAALLHDVGKLDISRKILYKAARLTEEEFGEIKRHVSIGMSILKPIGGSLRRILPIILSHHDKFDGSGYDLKKGEEIPLETRILSVADVYDALTSDRPYRKGMSPLDAKETIVKQSGQDFDPRVVEAFLAVFRRGEMEAPDIVF